MTRALISRGEAGGLAVAVALHAGLLALLVMRPSPRPLPEPERMSVTLADDVGLEATSPSKEEAAADQAPELGLKQPEPQAAPIPKPAPKPEPVRQEVVRPQPAPVPQPVSKPAPVLQPKPAPQPAKPLPAPNKPAPVKPVPAKPAQKVDPVGAAIAASGKSVVKAPAPRVKQAGGARIGADFLKGVTTTGNGKAQTPPAKVAGANVQNALKGAISRQLKPFWRVPQGVDTELLVTVLSFDLNPDGTLAGPVTVVRQEGVTDANRAQAALHKENAIRAVKLAAPFPLPADYYDTWKHLTNVRFDRNLSQ